jgi:hypothetical protein
MHINGGVVDYALEGYNVGRKESTLYVSMPATFEVVSHVGASIAFLCQASCVLCKAVCGCVWKPELKDCLWYVFPPEHWRSMHRCGS